MFTTSVDQQNLSKVSKFTYLKGVLRGTAAAAISGIIAITNDNYDLAVTLLKESLEEWMLSLNPCTLSCKVFQGQLINLQKSVKHKNKYKRY